MRQINIRFERQLLFLAAMLSCALAATNSSAATIFESGTLGATGIPRTEITGGSNVSPVVFVGARFYIDQPVVATQIGGHFVKNIGAEESFFGAIATLTDGDDFPDSGDLSTSDVVGTTLLAFPESSNEVFGTMAEPLLPGWYALVFGSGFFESSGSGVALNNGVDIENPAYIAFQPGFGWSNLEGFLSDFRFLVQGRFVPEPSTYCMAFLLLVFFSCIRRR